MPPTHRKSYRVPDATMAEIAALCSKLGGLEPATETAVLVEAVRRLHAAEFGAKKPKPKPAKT